MGHIWTQLFPPAPQFTEKQLESQKGKVFIVTGGASGLGLELVSILYKAGATVYIAGRSQEKGLTAIKNIQESCRHSSSGDRGGGRLEFLYLDLSDLATIKVSVEDFNKREKRLDVLWNNAGVGSTAPGIKSKQGVEIQFATNCLGPLLFTRLLLPRLKASIPTTSSFRATRVVWTASMMVDAGIPSGGMKLADLDNPPRDGTVNYTTSKLGNWFLASQLSKEAQFNGILQVTENPGNLKSDIWREWSSIFMTMVWPLLYDPIFGAYTALFAGLSPDLTESHDGGYIIPWGRSHPAPRADLLLCLKTKAEGGNGQAAEFIKWCDEKIGPFM